ncbi:MAG: 1-acyl-sn-glycerol-3-phosphate acyltransferase [Chloroflexi bacterium]|nr:1-acyl-sn-glycerol-3-phosphate acyltransferase [Chloroflexota bacterium]
MSASDNNARKVLSAYFKILNRTCEVSGHTSLPRGAKIIAMNHTDGYDPLYLPLAIEDKPHFLLQDGLFKIPVIGKLFKDSGQIIVYRGTERAREAYEQACRYLREGKTVALFPEGKQAPAGVRIPAKTGAIRMALETGAPIVPLGLYTPPQNLTRLSIRIQGESRCGLWQFRGKSYLRFGEAWKVSQSAALDDPAHTKALTEELMNRIYRLVADVEKEIPCESHFSPQFIRPWLAERL